MLSHLYRISNIILLLLCLGNVCYGQISKGTKSDSIEVQKSYVAKMQEFAKNAASTSAIDLKADKAEQVQEATFVEIKKNLQSAKLYLRTGLDTAVAKRELLLIAQHANSIGIGIFANKQTIPTYRNLVTTEKI